MSKQSNHAAVVAMAYPPLSAAYKRHLAAICGDNVTGTNVRGLKKALNTNWRNVRGYSTGVTAPNVSAYDVGQLESAIARCQPLVTGELDATGRKLLLNRRYAKRLAPVADIIANLDCFRLTGFDEIGNGNHVPVYRAIAKDGRSFAFRNVAWQSGGNGPELTA